MIGLAGEKGSIQKLIIAFDHRVTDGLEISSFINDVLKDLVESYRTNKI